MEDYSIELGIPGIELLKVEGNTPMVQGNCTMRAGLSPNLSQPISLDEGKLQEPAQPALPLARTAYEYMDNCKAIAAWQGQCETVRLTNAMIEGQNLAKSLSNDVFQRNLDRANKLSGL